MSGHGHLERALDAARRPRRVDWILDAASGDPTAIARATAELEAADRRLAERERVVRTCSHAHQLDHAVDTLRGLLEAINTATPALRRSPAFAELCAHPAVQQARQITQEVA